MSARACACSRGRVGDERRASLPALRENTLCRRRALPAPPPRRTSYGVSDSLYALTQLAQTTMRSELGKITLDKCFEERDSLVRVVRRRRPRPAAAAAAAAGFK